MKTRELAYRYFLRRHRLPANTLAVGNIACGGCGKTPIVISLCEALRERGAGVAVVTRGYRSGLRRGEYIFLRDGKTIFARRRRDFALMLDEAMMVSCSLPQVPVIVGANRVKAVEDYCRRYELPRYFVLDDAFQHLRILADKQIVLLDASSPFAGGKVLPAGGLREKVGALRRADVVLFTRTMAGKPRAVERERVERYVPKIAEVSFQNTAIRAVSATCREFRDTDNPVLLICGVAFPRRVLAEVRKFSCLVLVAMLLADHERVDRGEVHKVLGRVNAVVLTAKDYYREREFYDNLGVPVFILELTNNFRLEMIGNIG